MPVKSCLQGFYSSRAPILKRDKILHFSKYKTLETNCLTFKKLLFSSSTLDPATRGKPYRCRAFRIFRMSAETVTRQLNKSFPMPKNIERIKKYVCSVR